MNRTGPIALAFGLALTGLCPAAFAQWGTVGGPLPGGAAAVDPAPILGQLETACQSLYLRVANTGMPMTMLSPMYGQPASGGFITYNPALANALSGFWGVVRGIQRGGVGMTSNPYAFAQDMTQLSVLAGAVDNAMATGVSDPSVQADWAACRQLLATLSAASPAYGAAPVRRTYLYEGGLAPTVRGAFSATAGGPPPPALDGEGCQEPPSARHGRRRRQFEMLYPEPFQPTGGAAAPVSR